MDHMVIQLSALKEILAMFYTATAYRWGFLNNSHYVVYVGDSQNDAINAADAEAESRGGKYGVLVKSHDREQNVTEIHYAPSAYGEKAPFCNPRIQAEQDIGSEILMSVEDGKRWVPHPEPKIEGQVIREPVDIPDWIKAMVKKKLEFAEIIYPWPSSETSSAPPVASELPAAEHKPTGPQA